VCNAVETLLVDRGIAKYLYPKLAELLRVHGVEIRGDVEVLSNWPGAKSATEKDWRTEYLDLILSVKTVAGLEEAPASFFICRNPSAYSSSVSNLAGFLFSFAISCVGNRCIIRSIWPSEAPVLSRE